MRQRLFKDSVGRYSVQIDIHLINRIRNLCCKNSRLETGGILIGKYSPDLSCAIVKFIDGPPQDSSFGPTWFHRGIRGLKDKLEVMWSRERLHYLGEWHYHPFSSPEPSSIDHEYMKAIKYNAKVHCSVPVLLILGGNPALDNCPISVSVYDKGSNYISLPEI